jgi:hypothetical protein
MDSIQQRHKTETGVIVAHDSRFIPRCIGLLSYRYCRGTLNLVSIALAYIQHSGFLKLNP